MTIRTILVDDEKLAIQGLELRLAKFPEVEIIDTCTNGREAIRKIKTEKPDLVFCDIQMPGFDGFSVVSGVIEIDPPLFVFVTAYSEHAIRAFEANAVDYLLKPVEQSRLADALDRARTRLAEKRGLEEAEKLKKERAAKQQELDRLQGRIDELVAALKEAPSKQAAEAAVKTLDLDRKRTAAVVKPACLAAS